jgi:hypothetical protein
MWSSKIPDILSFCEAEMYEKHFSTQEMSFSSVVLVRKRNIPTEQPPFVGEVSANFSG